MYVRPPSQNNRIKLPENYGGNAFSGGAYNDMPPPARQSTPPPPRDVPKNELPAKSSPLANSIRETGQMPPPPQADQYYEPSNDLEEQVTISKEEALIPSEQTAHGSIFSSLLPRALTASGFPFGHGIGTEEILILGIMLLVYLSGNDKDETDNELILLLGLLLFAG